MEIRPDRWNEAQFLPGSSCIDTAIWMHYMDANQTAGEETWRQLHKYVESNTEQVLATTPHETPTILRTILNKSWRQHPTWRKLYRSDEPDTPDTTGEAKTSSLVTYYYGPPHMAKQKQDDQPELTYSSYVRTQDVTQKTCRRWWTIEKSGERWSRISVLAARLDDNDDDIPNQISACVRKCLFSSNLRVAFRACTLSPSGLKEVLPPPT